MEFNNALSAFFQAIQNDGRISCTHIGVFAALLKYRIDRGSSNTIQAYSYEIMELAKISAKATYHRCVRQLSEYGYIQYSPSYKCNQASKISFPEPVTEA